MQRSTVDRSAFNPGANLPFELRPADFELAMQDIYDFFFDVNSALAQRGLDRLDEILRPAAMSGLLSDMLSASLARHSRSLTENRYHNGHPDLLLKGIYPGNAVASAPVDHGIEVKSTQNRGGAVDTHGARDQWMCVFVYQAFPERDTPTSQRQSMKFLNVYLAQVTRDDFRRNQRGELGTRTATLNQGGLAKLRASWVYRGEAAS